jgi:hypothetical protein
MEKEFIPYEQALALKELGFDEPCFGLYENKKIGYSWETSQGIVTPITYRRNSKFVEHILSKGDCTSPTFSQSFRWFREKYKLDKTIDIWTEQPVSDEIWDKAYQYYINGEAYHPYFKTYEEAELECLKKLIEIVKEK